MYAGFLQRALEDINSVKRHIHISEALRAVLSSGLPACAQPSPCLDPVSFGNPPDTIQWRIIDHCSTVSRLYAIYEQFAHELARDFVGYLQKNYRFSDLDTIVLGTYRAGVSYLLVRSDWVRYASISMPDLIASYAECLSGKSIYKLEPECFLTHEKNLQYSDLSNLFSRCGVAKVSEWIDGHLKLTTFFMDQEREGKDVKSELRKFVQYRNDAAHGGLNVGGIVGVKTLTEFAEFLELLCEALAEKIQLEIIERSLALNRPIGRGEATEVFRGRSVAVGKFLGTFQVGSSVYLTGTNYCSEVMVEELMIDDVSIAGISITLPIELGMKVKGKVTKGAIIYAIAQPSREKLLLSTEEVELIYDEVESEAEQTYL